MPEFETKVASVDDAEVIAGLLDDFNIEFETESPGVAVLAARLRCLLGGPAVFAVVAGAPAVSVALVTLRPSVWYHGAVATLDEMYVVPTLRGRGIGSAVLRRGMDECALRGDGSVEINVDESEFVAARLYRRHGFTDTDPSTNDKAFYFFKEL